MKERLKILLYRDTLVLAALQASLAAQPDLDVVGLNGMAASEQTLCALRPNVIIFDLGAVQPAFHYALVEQLPDLLLVGIDASTNRVLVWSGQQSLFDAADLRRSHVFDFRWRRSLRQCHQR